MIATVSVTAIVSKPNVKAKLRQHKTQLEKQMYYQLDIFN